MSGNGRKLANMEIGKEGEKNSKTHRLRVTSSNQVIESSSSSMLYYVLSIW